MSRAPAHMHFALDDLTIAACSRSPAHLAWLREFLEPDFAVGDRERVDCEVVIDEDGPRYAGLAGAGPPADAHLLDCFALDSSVVRLPIIRRDDSATCVLDAQFDAVYVIEPRPRRVTIVTTPGNRRVRASLLRVVREFAMNHMHGRALLLHASAIAVGDAGLVIAGHKAAGKTTLLTYLLSRRAGRYLSNDRVLVTDGDGAQLVRNIPTVISVRPGTLEFLPEFGRRFETSGFWSYLLTLDEAAASTGEPIVPNQFGSYFLSPAQFRQLVDAPQKHRCMASVLVFPVISTEPGTFDLRELSETEALARLPETFLGAGGWRKGTDAFAIPGTRPAPDEANLMARAERLLSCVRAYECLLGPHAYRDGALASELAGLTTG